MYVRLLLMSLALVLLAISAAAQTNNCCSIDRQCSTNDEWVSGYYAFRNSECGVESQQPPHQTRQDQTPSQNNNCCFSSWDCSTDRDWLIGYWAFRYDQCNPPAQEQNQDQSPQQRQNRRGNSNGRPQPSQKREPETISITISPGGPNEQTHTTNDGTPVYSSANDPEYMCHLNPGSHWCDQIYRPDDREYMCWFHPGTHWCEVP